MRKQKRILEQYLKERLSDKAAFSITQIDKLRDGWESDNYNLSVEYGMPKQRANWVWRIYSGEGNREKAGREFISMQKLFAAGYPVPYLLLLEKEHSPVNRPFIIMEYIPGEVMWRMLDLAPVDHQERLIDQFCQLFVRLHQLDWKLFDASLPDDDPFFFIDKWLDSASRLLKVFPEIDAAPFLDWVTARHELYACTRPSPVHQDFHPGNVLIKADLSALVIDWTNFDVTDYRFDLAWTLVLAEAHGWPGLRDQILQGYQHHAGEPVEQIEVFEAIACARRLLDVSVSLTHGAHLRGMNVHAAEAMQANMEAHQRVYEFFIKNTGLQIGYFDNLFKVHLQKSNL